MKGQYVTKLKTKFTKCQISHRLKEIVCKLYNLISIYGALCKKL